MLTWLLTESTEWSKSLSTLGVQAWDKETENVQKNLDHFMDNWLAEMKKNSKTVIGVSIKAGNPENSMSPYFPSSLFPRIPH